MTKNNLFAYVISSGALAALASSAPVMQMASDSDFIPRRILVTGNAGMTLQMNMNAAEVLSNIPFPTSLLLNSANAGLPIMDLNVWKANAQITFNFNNSNAGGGNLTETVLIFGEKIPVQP